MSANGPTRRQVLRSTIAGVSGSSVLAGAGGSVVAGRDGPNRGVARATGAIESVVVHEGDAYVRVTSPAAADAVAVEAPDGRRRYGTDLGLGERAGALPMLSTRIDDGDDPPQYLPDFQTGTYETLAYAGPEGDRTLVGRRTVDLRPGIAVADVRVPEDAPPGGAILDVENTGTGPLVVDDLTLVTDEGGGRVLTGEVPTVVAPGDRLSVLVRTGTGETLADRSRDSVREERCDGETVPGAVYCTSGEHVARLPVELTLTGSVRFRPNGDSTRFGCSEVDLESGG